MEIAGLIAHEKISRERLNEVMEDIRKSGIIRYPVIIDRKTKTILDGHHRTEACRLMGLKRVPAFLVNYSDSRIKVTSRRNIPVSKREVIKRGQNSLPFPHKTTKHILPFRKKRIDIPISRLNQ